jgi:hypothetical protein
VSRPSVTLRRVGTVITGLGLFVALIYGSGVSARAGDVSTVLIPLPVTLVLYGFGLFETRRQALLLGGGMVVGFAVGTLIAAGGYSPW